MFVESQKKKRKRMELKAYFENDGKLKFVKMHKCADSSG